jgi:hypothetical protein
VVCYGSGEIEVMKDRQHDMALVRLPAHGA